MSATTFLTTDQLAERIQYDARTIREQLKDSVLIEGVHYVRPFGRRKKPKPFCDSSYSAFKSLNIEDITTPLLSKSWLKSMI